MASLREALAAVVPEAAKRRHERWLVQRHRARLGPPTAAYLERHGPQVLHGPFQGLRYPEALAAEVGAVGKLVGSYEAELFPVVERWLAERPACVVNVGCAEGFYAVGFALADPAVEVRAFDLDARARERSRELAAYNGVGDRIVVEGECTPATFETLPADGVAVLCDIEGAELELLDPARAPRLRGWDVLVELHDFVNPTITQTLTERFSPTHDVEIIHQRSTEPEVEELGFLTAAERRVVLDEFRPSAMSWAAMTPKAAGAPAA